MDLSIIIALAVIAVFGFLGFRDGVIKRIIEIAGVFVTLLLTARFATALAPSVMEKTGVGEGPALLITWAGLFVVGLILSRVLATFLSKLFRLTILSGLDRLGGVVLGLAFGTLVVSVVLVAASQVPGGKVIQESFDEAPVGRFIFYASPNIYRFAQGLGGGDGDSIWNRVLDTTGDQAGQAAEKVREAVEETADDLKDEVQEKLEDSSG